MFAELRIGKHDRGNGMALTSIEPAELAACGCDGYGRLDAILEERLRQVELVAVDMDGTLLGDDKRVSRASRAAICRALDAGVRVVPASGRVTSILPKELFGIEGIRYAVCCAGASVQQLGTDPSDCKSLHETGFTPDGAAGVVQMLKDRFGADIYIDVACAGQVYTAREELDLLPGFDLTGISLPFTLSTCRVMPNLIEGIRSLPGEIGHVNIFGRTDALLHEVMAWLKQSTPYELANSLQHNVEINAPGTSKWNGLIWLCEHLGVRPDRIMALGDGANDLDMVHHAWMGVAMRNGIAELKEQAAAVTCYTNEEDGVARVLDDMVRIKREVG